MVNYFPLIPGLTVYHVYTFIIPPNWGASNKSITVSIPLGAIMQGASGGGTYTISGINATGAYILQNGSSFPYSNFTVSNPSNPTTKSFVITTANSAYIAGSYFNSYSFTFTPTASTTTTYTYDCYLYLQNATYNCSISTNFAYVPTNYGILINPDCYNTAYLNNVTWASGSGFTTTGYLRHNYVVNNDFMPPSVYNGLAVFDSIFCNKLNTPYVNRNFRPYPELLIAEVFDRHLATYTNIAMTTVYNALVIILSGIYLYAGMNIKGIMSFINAYPASGGAQVQYCLFDSIGKLLASTAIFVPAIPANSNYVPRNPQLLTASYIIPRTGYYYIGCSAFGTSSTIFPQIRMQETINNPYLNDNISSFTVNSASTLDNISAGAVQMNQPLSDLPPNNYTFTGTQTKAWFGLY